MSQEKSDRARPGRFPGVRLVGIFVPWQAVILTLGLLMAVTALAAVRWAGGGQAEVHLASADDSTTTTVPPSIEPTSSSSTTTATMAEEPTTTSTARVAAPKVTSTTTTTVAPPTTCAVIGSSVSGTVGASWVSSPTTLGTRDRHITVTVTNPTNQPVVLGYIMVRNRPTSHVFQLAETNGQRLGAGESVTVENIFNYGGDHTARHASLPDELYSVEFSPVSAPALFCQSDVDHPGDTRGVKRHPTAPSVIVGGQEQLASGGAIYLPFRAEGLFPGLRVHYRMLMKDGGFKEFAVDLPTGLEGLGSQATARHPLEELKDFGTLSYSGHTPWFQGITTVEWDGVVKPCTSAISSLCAPADGSLLDRH